MPNVTKDLGPVSGYAIAVANGYTGTEAEWIQLVLAGTANAQSAAGSAATAAAGAESAAQKATEAASSATAATGAASAASDSASAAAGSASAASGSAAAAASSKAAAAASAEDAHEDAVAAAQVAASIPADYNEVARRTLAAFPQENAEGSVVDFADGADGLPVADLTVQIEAVQAGTGDPSPDNIRPITGWTGVDLRRTGKNLWGGAAMLADMKAAVPSATVDEAAGTIRYAASAHANHTAIGTGSSGITYGMRFKENTRYTLVVKYSNTAISSGHATTNISIVYTDGTYSIITGPSGFEANVPGIAVFTSVGGKTVERIGKVNNYGTVTIYTNESGLFEGVLTADDFEPYVGTSYPITFPTEAGTVYGGSLDVTTGVLTVRNKLITINHVNSVSLPSGYAMVPLGARGYTVSSAGKSNILRRSNVVSTEFDVFNVQNSSAYGRDQIAFRLSGVDTTGTTAEVLSAINAKLDEFVDAGAPLQVLYELTTPETYQLTPTEVTTLLGWNTLYADTGDVAVKYRADPQRYTDGRLAAVRKIISGVEDGLTASHNYAVGDFLIVGDALYRVTAAIATGGSITPDTNVTATTVAEQLKALYASIA